MTATPSETHEAELSDERLRDAMVAGWNACRKSVYAVCEDVQSEGEKHRSDTENAPRHHFGRGYMTAAKSIARGFNSMEAMDDDNLTALLARRTQPSAGEGIDHAIEELCMLGENAFRDDPKRSFGAIAEAVFLLRNATPPDQSRVERLEAALRKISDMRTFPDDKMNTLTLAAAHKVAEEALHGDRP